MHWTLPTNTLRLVWINRRSELPEFELWRVDCSWKGTSTLWKRNGYWYYVHTNLFLWQECKRRKMGWCNVKSNRSQSHFFTAHCFDDELDTRTLCSSVCNTSRKKKKKKKRRMQECTGSQHTMPRERTSLTLYINKQMRVDGIWCVCAFSSRHE